jgi:hypothetical protein
MRGMVTVGFGLAAGALVPGCYCDACDEDSKSLIEQVDEIVQVAVEGCREYRRPYTPKPDIKLHNGPWMQVGYEWRGGRSARARAASASPAADTARHSNRPTLLRGDVVTRPLAAERRAL